MFVQVKIYFVNNVVKVYQLNDILSFTCSENVADTQISLQPGICEQFAEISLYDRDNYLHEYIYGIDQNDNRDEIKVEILCGEDLNNMSILGTYYASEWNINGDDSVVKIKCRDKTYLLDSITASSLPRNGNKTLTQLLTTMFSEMHDAQWAFLDTETQYRCNVIVVYDAWYLSSSLRDLLNKVCSLGMLRIFCLNDVFYVGRSV